MTITFPKYIDIKHAFYIFLAMLALRVILIIEYFKKEEEIPIGYESANPNERKDSNT